VLYYSRGDLYGGDFPIKACTGRGRRIGLMLVAPDTSPGAEPRIPGDADMWDFGRVPDSTWTRPRSLVGELPHVQLCHTRTSRSRVRPICRTGRRTGIFGPLYGRPRALTLALRIRRSTGPCRHSRPSQRRCKPFGDKGVHQLPGTRSGDLARTRCDQLVARKPFPAHILIDQGAAINFSRTKQLLPKIRGRGATAGQKLPCACSRL